MTIENEANQEPVDEETQRILDEIREENPEEEEISPEETEEDKGKQDDSEEEDSEDDSENGSDEDQEEEEEKPNRAPKMMPAWQHEKEKKRWEKEKKELLEQVQGKAPEKTKDKTETKEIPKSVKDLAKKYDIKEEFASDLLDVIKANSGNIDSDTLKAIEEFKKNQEETKVSLAFNKEFEKTLPLIKKEYPDISEENLSSIKAKLKDLAFSEQYGKTPLSVIFKGIDDFRDITVSKRKTVESSNNRKSPDDKSINYENMTEEDLSKLNGKELEDYFTWLEKKG